MDDRHGQFAITVADLFTAAALAQLLLEIRTRDGNLIIGVPDATSFAGGEQLDDTECGRRVALDGHWVELSQIIECAVSLGPMA